MKGAGLAFEPDSDDEMEKALLQRRRAQVAQRFLSGKWDVELETFDADQERDRQQAHAIAP